MFAVTGASGHFGRLVLDALIAEVPASQVVALARDPAKVSDCSKAGVVVRLLNYNEEETLRPALAGVERLLFISGSEHGSSHVDGRHRLSLGDNCNGRLKGKMLIEARRERHASKEVPSLGRGLGKIVCSAVNASASHAS